MTHTKQLQDDIQQTHVLSDLMAAYEELAALRMKKIREEVIKSREFHETLRGYFHEILNAKSHEVHTEKPKKQLALLISDDKGLYGDILDKTRTAFVTHAQDNASIDLAVIGTSGISLLKDSLPNRDITIFSFSEEQTSLFKLTDILSFIADYTSITVFHGKFMSLVNQQAEKTLLIGEDATIVDSPTKNAREYLFEPSRENLLSFFQKEILALLFEESILEGSLAKQASRMISLEQASTEAKKRIQKLGKMKRMLKAQRDNKEQITYLAGLSLWKVH